MIDKNKMEQWGPVDAKILYMSFWFKPLVESGRTKYKAAWPDVKGFFIKDRITYTFQNKEMEERGIWAIKILIDIL